MLGSEGANELTDIAFGFVAICLSEKRCSPAGNITVKSVQGLDEEAVRLRIISTASRNIENTIRIMHFLRGNDLSLYRMSANLVPLATHPMTDGFEWWEEPTLASLLSQLGDLIQRQEVRISSHLPQVCVLSTPKDEVFQWLQRYGEYHRRLYTAMGLDERAKIVLHVGGSYNDPEGALRRAEKNFARLDPWLQRRLVLENDDKSFSARHVLSLTRRLGIPMVFDYHHHVVHNHGETPSELADILGQAFASWTDRPPKVHMSSPRSAEQPRAHADYVDWQFALPFFELVQRLGPERLDVMVEAKQKDLAALDLRTTYQREMAP